MRRMRQALKRPYFLRKASTTKDVEGNELISWSTAVSIDAIIRKASGRLDIAQYGQRLNYIMKMQYEGDESIKEGDGVCVYVGAEDEPDYKVVSEAGLTEDTFRTYVLEAL